MTYDDALKRGRRQGAANCDDSALMALYCADVLQTLAGALSPRLVWQGGQKSRLTSLQLNQLVMSDPLKVADLMWL